MMQYMILDIASSIDSINFRVLADYFRVQIRGTKLNYDQNMTALAFLGVENTDWAFISRGQSLGATTGVFRVGVRDGYWVEDQTLTSLGFDGAVNTDWKNYAKNRLLP